MNLSLTPFSQRSLTVSIDVATSPESSIAGHALIFLPKCAHFATEPGGRRGPPNRMALGLSREGVQTGFTEAGTFLDGEAGCPGCSIFGAGVCLTGGNRARRKAAGIVAGDSVR